MRAKPFYSPFPQQVKSNTEVQRMEVMMVLRTRIGLAILWAASLLAVGVWGHAQTFDNRAPVVISGSDFGFRVEGRRGNTPTGTLVVRMNGEWVPVESAPGVKGLTAK